MHLDENGRRDGDNFDNLAKDIIKRVTQIYKKHLTRILSQRMCSEILFKIICRMN